MQTPTTQLRPVHSVNLTPNQNTYVRHATQMSRHQSPALGRSTNAESTPSPCYPANPFETDVEHLQHGVVTPGLFQKVISPDKMDKPFKWDIEHIALLHPAEINELPERQFKRVNRYDKQVDEVAQKAIDKFFCEPQIVPSPWGAPVQKINLLAKIDEEERINSKRNASCQTYIHIPLDVDFNNLLKAYTLNESRIEELNRSDSSSSSSLRRKLFGNESSSDSDGLRASSPSEAEGRNVQLVHKAERQQKEECLSPPPAEVRSSSPMMSPSEFNFGSCRRCSVTAMQDEKHLSPDLSPISSRMQIRANRHESASPGFEYLASPSPIGSQHIVFECPGSFDFTEEYQLSNCGLSDDEAHSSPLPAEMSIEVHSSFAHHLKQEHMTLTDPPLQPTELLHANNKRADSSCLEEQMEPLPNYKLCAKPAEHRLVLNQEMPSACHLYQEVTNSTADTGYQTCSLTTTSDVSVSHEIIPLWKWSRSNPHSAIDAKTSGIDFSMSNEQHGDRREWVPPSASTPNKIFHQL